MPQPDLTKLRLLLFDVDGVLTDGTIIVNADGTESKRFNIRDGAAMVWARRTGLMIGLLSARSADDHTRALRLPPIAAMPVEYLTPAIEDRAVEVQALLAARGQHRAPSIPDLLVAATAELTARTVLHLDKDFDLIAQLTGQPLQRIET